MTQQGLRIREEVHLSEAAFANDFEVVKIVRFDPKSQNKRLELPRQPSTTIHRCFSLIWILTEYLQLRNFVD